MVSAPMYQTCLFLCNWKNEKFWQNILKIFFVKLSFLPFFLKKKQSKFNCVHVSAACAIKLYISHRPFVLQLSIE